MKGLTRVLLLLCSGAEIKNTLNFGGTQSSEIEIEAL